MGLSEEQIKYLLYFNSIWCKNCKATEQEEQRDFTTLQQTREKKQEHREETVLTSAPPHIQEHQKSNSKDERYLKYSDADF